MQPQKYDDNTEKELLGAILRDPKIVPAVLEILPDHKSFRDLKIGAIYESIVKRDLESKPIDIPLLGEDGHSLSFMVGLIEDSYGVFANAKPYAEAIKDRGKRRKVWVAAKKLAEDVVNEDKPLLDVVSEAETALATLAQGNTDNPVKTPADLMPIAMKAIDDYACGVQPEGVVRSGIDVLDQNLQLMPSDLIVIAGWTSQGKSQLALQIAQWNAVHEGLPVLIFSLEMSADQVMMRMIMHEASIDSTKMKRKVGDGGLDADEMDRITRAKEHLLGAPIYIYDDPTLTMPEMRAIAKRLSIREGVGLVIVDYIQLVQPPQGDQRVEQVSAISRGLKVMAQELKVPMIALSQLTDLPVGIARRPPRLGDMRESKAIAHDANTVLFVYQIPTEHEPTRAEIIVGKNRDGARSGVMMSFNKGRWLERSIRKEN